MKLSDKEIEELLYDCWHTAHLRAPGKPHCFIEGDAPFPKWIEASGGQYFYYTIKSRMSLDLGDGTKIPFYDVWILCPEHKVALEKAGVTFDVA